ncbi:MAG: gliding motility-associated ABC transporter substrate-binding protein GldG [Ferruginibacter sp.]
MKFKNILNQKGVIIFFLVMLVAINWAASIWHTRLDLTNEKRFTLSSPTKTLLKNLDDKVNVTVFLKGASNSGFTKLAKSTEELLNEFREINGSKFQYKFIDPDDMVEGTSTSWADTLQSMGAAPLIVNAQIKSGEQQLKIYPVAMAAYKEKLDLISLYAGNSINLTVSEINSSEAMLEYAFSNSITRLKSTTKPMVAYSIGNGEAVGPESYDLRTMLQYDDTLFALNLDRIKFIPDTFKILIIVKPTIAFNEDEKLKIDQYVMRGGKLLLFEDKLNAEMDSIKANNEVVAYDRELGLNDLLFKYGVRINSDIVMDLQCDKYPFDLNGNSQYQLISWNYFPLIQTKPTHLINKNLGIISSRFANSIDTSIDAEGLKRTILLSTSENSRTISTPAIISTKENRQEPDKALFNKSNIPIAVLMEGKFTSLYKNRISQSQLDTFNYYGVDYYSESKKDNKMIVVADGDIVLNEFYKQEPLPMGVNPYSMVKGQQTYPLANRSFLQNCVEYLINENGLMEAKSKDYTPYFLNPKKIEKEKTSWQLLNIATPILAVILFGLFFQWHRKRKYTKGNI